MSEVRKWPFEWSDLSVLSRKCAEEQAKGLATLTDFIGPVTGFVKAIIGGRRSAANGPRPQDHAAVGLCVQAFRLCVASLTAAVGGYADACPLLNRSIWELQLRLFDIRQAPVAGALGYLLYGADEETRSREYEKGAKIAIGPEHERELGIWASWREDVRKRAQAAGVSVTELKRHGKLIFREVAEAAELESSYRTLYARHSAIAHGSGASTMYTYLLSTRAMTGEGAVLLPFKAWTLDGVGDAIGSALVCFALAAQILGEEQLYFEITNTLERFDEDWVRLRAGSLHSGDRS